MKRIFLLITIVLQCTLLSAQSWQRLGTATHALNANHEIDAICVDSGGVVYAGGGFTDSAALPPIGKFYVAKWDGTNWGRLGHGSDSILGNGGVNTMCIDAAHNLYVAGTIKDANGKCFVAKWDGNVWSEVGTGAHALNANDEIWSICMDGAGNLYAAGFFTDSTSRTSGHRYVAKWDGTSWSELGTGSNALNADYNIWSIIVANDGYVYASVFRLLPGDYWYVAQWDGTSWSELGTGSNALDAENDIMSLCADPSGNIYATATVLGNSYVAKWDGTSWSELGTGGPSALSICSDKAGNIYAAGILYDSVHPAGHWCVVKYNGAKWYEVGAGSGALNANGLIFALCVDTALNIYAGGSFTDSVTGYGHRYVAWCHDVSEEIISIKSGEGIMVYPDPADDRMTISVPAGLTGVAFHIIDAKGSLVYAGRLAQQENTVSIAMLPAGMYLLRIDGVTQSYKIIKK